MSYSATATSTIYEIELALAGVVRAISARRGEDPRLVEAVAVLRDPSQKFDTITVRLRDGRIGDVRRDGCDFLLHGERGLIRSAAMAAGRAFAQAAAFDAGWAKAGLPGDGWWRELNVERASEARQWTRRLLALPAMSDADADRFIASLDPPKREALLQRAYYGVSPEGF